VRFSVALDDGITCQQAVVAVAAPVRRKRLPCLREQSGNAPGGER
jgi:hypothetical protein